MVSRAILGVSGWITPKELQERHAACDEDVSVDGRYHKGHGNLKSALPSDTSKLIGGIGRQSAIRDLDWFPP